MAQLGMPQLDKEMRNRALHFTEVSSKMKTVLKNILFKLAVYSVFGFGFGARVSTQGLLHAKLTLYH